jgi:Domain of unknown function (DUF4326)
MNRVVHVNREHFDIYMGREWAGHACSIWHNPFRIKSGIRGTALLEFADYFFSPEQKWLRDAAITEISDGAVLGCWCNPLACHADMVAGYLHWKRTEANKLVR